MAKVRKDPKGRVLHKGEEYWKSRGIYRYSFTDSLGNRKFIYAKDLGELREKERLHQKDKLDGLDTYVSGQADVNFVFDRYIATKTDLRGTTKSGYIYTYDRYVRKGFGKKKIAGVHYSDVLMFYNALLGKGLKVNTIDSIHTLLRPTFQLAVRDNIIRRNPADGAMAEIKKSRDGTEGIRHALSVEVENAFIDYLDELENPRWKPLFIFMFGTGCRIGETIGIRWEDVDFEKNEININHSVSYYSDEEGDHKCKYKVWLPKTAAGIRVIPMLQKVSDALQLEKKNQETYGYHNSAEVDGMSGFIFCNRLGGMFNDSTINRAIRRIVADYNSKEEVKARREGREAVIIPHFSCHITRHTFCTRLCENETNIKVIQSIMGHRDIQTTMNIYAEVSEMKKQEEIKKLNDKNVV